MVIWLRYSCTYCLAVGSAVCRRFVLKLFSKYFLTGIAILVSSVWLINGQFASIPVNRWTQFAEMSTQRSSACSVQMSDGRVLVAGGRSDSAVLSTVEVSGTDG